MKKQKSSNPNTTHWPFLYGKGSGISGDSSMGNYGQYDSGGGYLSDAERNAGDVWQTDSGRWAGKHSTGDIDYFSDKESAHNFASGKVFTQPPTDATADEDPYNLYGEDPYIGHEDPLNIYGDEELRMDPDGPMDDAPIRQSSNMDLDRLDGPECQFCGSPTNDGDCKSCDGYDRDDPDNLDTVDRTYSFDEGIDNITLHNLLERNYKREYELYQGTSEQKKRRAQRNKTRRKFEREGKVRKGDGVDIHHRDGNPFNQSSKNTVPMSKSKNRSMKERTEITELDSDNEVLRLKEIIKSLVRKKLLIVFKHMSGKNEV